MASETLVLSATADALLTVEDAGEVTARCQLWWRNESCIAGEKTGLIGSYQAANDAAAADLLSQSCALLKEQGCTVALGPMDGSTWKSYRFITKRGSEPIFFLEPDNKDAYPDQFLANGFEVCVRYMSAVSANLRIEDEKSEALRRRFLSAGIRLRTLNLADFENELRKIHAICLQSFAANPFYTPISESEFVAQYLPLKNVLVPDVIVMAEHDGRLVGFNFLLPDPTQKGTVIVKTLARLPEHKYAGLGQVLLSEAQNLAAESGFTRVIHALFHKSNKSAVLSGRYAEVIREYSLFAKRL